MELAQERELCRLVIINKIDCRDAKPAEVLQQVPLTPSARNVCRSICPADRPVPPLSIVFFQATGSRRRTSPPSSAAHTQIIDQVIELDEQLMALYLEQGEEISPEQLHDPFEQALREGHLIPVCFVSAETRCRRSPSCS